MTLTRVGTFCLAQIAGDPVECHGHYSKELSIHSLAVNSPTGLAGW